MAITSVLTQDTMFSKILHIFHSSAKITVKLLFCIKNFVVFSFLIISLPLLTNKQKRVRLLICGVMTLDLLINIYQKIEHIFLSEFQDNSFILSSD